MGGILKRNSVVIAIRRTTKSKTPRRPDKPVEQPPCAICQEPVGVLTPDGITEGWSTLSCGHTFGSICIKKWLGMIDRPCCPMCREDVAHSCGHAVLPVVDKEPGTAHLRGEKWKAPPRRVARDDPRKTECGFCNMSPRMRTRLRTRILIKAIRLVLVGTRQRRHVHSMDNWQRAQAVLRQQEVREEWEDWWDMQEPRTDREREPSSTATTSLTTLPDAGTVSAAAAEGEAGHANADDAVSVVTNSVLIPPRSLSNAATTGSSGRAASF